MSSTQIQRPKALLVLGMHRSGTSAATRVINLLGADLGKNLITPGPDNPDGFWEHAEAVSINDDLLHSLGRTWYDMREMPENWRNRDVAKEAFERIKTLIERDFASKPFVVMKDPRMCLTASLWVEAFQALGFEVSCLFVVRDPREVVDSLHVRNKWAREPLFLMWVQYIMEAASATRHCARTLITFDQILSDWQRTMHRVADDLSIGWPTEMPAAMEEINAFLKKDRRHHVAAETSIKEEAKAGMPRFAAALYQECLRIADGNGGWGGIENLEATLRGIAGLYGAHVDQLLTLRWYAEGRAQSVEARAAKSLAISQEALAGIERGIIERGDSMIKGVAEVAGQLATMQLVHHEQMRELSASVKALKSGVDIIKTNVEEVKSGLETVAGNLQSQNLGYVDGAARADERFLMVEHALQKHVADLQGSVRQKESVIQAYEDQLSRQKAQFQAITSSASWRITAPLRWFKTQLSPRGLKTNAGRCLKIVYRKLPMPTESRLALKGVLFKTVAPLIKNTRSYRAWQGHQARGGFGVPMGAKAGANAKSASGASSILDDLYSLAAGASGTEYVAMDGESVNPSTLDVRAIAFYLPQFHPIPENDEWWGKGFTEWTNVSKAVPQFVGHYQPHLPGELGFYDLRVVDVMCRQVELARHYGIQGFCFHYYWFAGKRLLEKPLQQFLDNKDIDFPFCICWANENWTRRWDGLDQEMLISQNYSPEDDIAFIAALEPLLRDPRYIRVAGRPLIVLYRPSILPDATATLERWRAHCRDVGIGELFIAMVQFDVDDPRTYGFDAAIEFPPHKLARDLQPINNKLQIVNPNYSGHVIDYQSVVQRARQIGDVDYAMFRGVVPSWDNEARKPGRGYTFANATPRRYREWLGIAIDYARRHPVDGERLIFINAWNEWAEGAHLEPDRRYGYAYLKQTRAALLAGADGKVAPRRVVVISHDAHPHGAQYLALHLVRELSQGMGLEVELVLLGGGRLESDFELLVPVHKLYGPENDVGELALDLTQRGFEFVIANTAVAGRVVEPLQKAGMKVVSLVHELPGVIRSYGLENAVRTMGEFAEHIVVPASVVGQGLKEHFTTTGEQAKLVVRPQGLFTRSRYRGLSRFDDARRNLRKRLSLPADAKIVLSVGYADRRKGIDLLAQAAIKCVAAAPDMHFVWVGHHDAESVAEATASLRDAGCDSHFHFVGMDFDTDDYYAGADVYALTSREDPFPSVVLESLSVRTPVVAFASTGGAADFISENGCGIIVPAFDVDMYAGALIKIAHDDAQRAELGEVGARLVDLQFSFRAYAMDLLKLGGMNIPRVSVVVPNYNYARYMRDRLASICDQSLPVYEIIVLDDASTDESLETLQKLRGDIHPEPLIVSNDNNSGSVFRQWLKGVELAKGEYVWIAEADDLSKPEFLARLTCLLDANPEAVIGYTQSEQIDESGRLIASDYFGYTDDLGKARWSENYVADGRAEVIAGLAVKNTLPNVSGVLFRREALLEVLRTHIDEIASYRIAGDWLVYLLLVKNGKIVFESSPCNKHRRHGNSVTLGSRGQELYEEVLRIQRTAEVMFELDDSTIMAARRYAHSLKSHFGLSDTDVAANQT